jgi:hypothetical protein
MSQPNSARDAPYAGVAYSAATGWVAWILFGSVLLVLVGTLHILIGLVALFRPQVLAATRADLLLPVGLDALAWFHLVLGAVAIATGLGLLRNRRWARVLAVGLCCLAILVNFAFVNVHPVWAVTASALAVLVMYAVVAHGSELADAYGTT